MHLLGTDCKQIRREKMNELYKKEYQIVQTRLQFHISYQVRHKFGPDLFCRSRTFSDYKPQQANIY